MNWEMYGVAIAALAFIYNLYRNTKKDLHGQFYQINQKIDSIKEDVSDIKERMAFLEAANIYTMPLEPVQPNARSAAAKEMWARRRQKKLERKEK